MKRIKAVEGEPLNCTAYEERLARRELGRFQKSLRPRLAFYDTRDGHTRPQNIVGTVRLDSRTVLDVSPKTMPDTDWVTSVVELMLPSRSSVSGSRSGSRSPQHRNLTDAIAIVYADRLERALRTEGPLELIERQELVSGTLHGKLDLARWTRTSVLTPNRFPVTTSRLTADNSFAAVMSFCADALSRDTRDAATGARLRSLSQSLRVGHLPALAVNASDAQRQLPPQWRGYTDVWDVATALLARQALVGAQGRLAAFNVAVESWPLLEELVQRTIDTMALLAAEEGMDWSRGHRLPRPLLRRGDSEAVEREARDVIPDGVLLESGRTRATFEAKYTRLNGRPAPRGHVFQAVATAAAHGAREAVLIYPERIPPVVFGVEGHHGVPARLIVQGVDLYAYRPGELTQAQALVDALRQVHSLPANRSSP
ncbi:hypothetical protein FAM23877_11395 [Propionibacterium freudenreichii]|uniref:5-methylcytosine restriction system specificity protein McrC n=1 Tax=Propionibacterium freudenreichii TaxID=1744 RepID=UPI00248585AE|nr:hypothetical protein [Propionibacterium freudenreichii]MDK9640016.1 hypothetical protein [Propionibacterium freudenreichii]WGU90238.1 hypothetical protein FAM23877_11395 [Propionibacterium freudenreichii]